MQVGEVDCMMTSPRPVCISVSAVPTLINHIDKNYLSKIITAGVINVAEPAATSVSVASNSARRFRLKPNGNGCLISRSCSILFLQICVYNDSRSTLV